MLLLDDNEMRDEKSNRERLKTSTISSYFSLFGFLGEKPYVCDICHRGFTQNNSLKTHRLIHSENKPVFKVCFGETLLGGMVLKLEVEG